MVFWKGILLKLIQNYRLRKKQFCSCKVRPNQFRKPTSTWVKLLTQVKYGDHLMEFKLEAEFCSVLGQTRLPLTLFNISIVSSCKWMCVRTCKLNDPVLRLVTNIVDIVSDFTEKSDHASLAVR